MELLLFEELIDPCLLHVPAKLMVLIESANQLIDWVERLLQWKRLCGCEPQVDEDGFKALPRLIR